MCGNPFFDGNGAALSCNKKVNDFHNFKIQLFLNVKSTGSIRKNCEVEYLNEELDAITFFPT